MTLPLGAGHRGFGDEAVRAAIHGLRLVALVALWAGCAGSVMAELARKSPTLEERLREINEDASVARKANKLADVEQKRRERWLCIAEFAEQESPPDSPWIRGYKAIELVDGSQQSVEADAGLLNELKYRDACDVLKKSFDEMAAVGNGPLLGEVATRLFEVAQQAKGIYRDALVPGSPDCVVDVGDIERALEIASKRDPCCVSAVAMLLYMQRPDAKEAFLRAEVRDSFKARQNKLVGISHPLILPTQKPVLWASKDRAARDEKPVEGDAAKAPKEVKLENEGEPVMPWHAAVELDKAMSLQYILEDLEYTQNLTPDHYLSEKGVPIYAIPGRLFSGTDAESAPCQLIYGQILLSRISEEGMGRRSVAFFITTALKDSKKQFLWDHRYIDLLWRVPTDEELADSVSLRRKQELLNSHAARKRWKLGEQEFRLYDFPIRDTERCLQEQMQVLCLRSVDAIERWRFTPTRNSPDMVFNIQTKAEQLSRTPFMTSAPVQVAINEFRQSNDPTKHSLIELMKSPSRNPLVVVSELKVGVKPGDRSPNLIPGDEPGEPPYVMLDERKKLHIALSGRPEAPCSWVEYDGATAFMPLTPKAIPRAILLASEIGTAFIKVLQAAGYTEEEAVGEIMKAMTEGGDYLPTKFRALLSARINALVKAKLKENSDATLLKQRFEALNPWMTRFFSTVPERVTPDLFKSLVAAEMLQEQGWYGRAELKPALEDLFQKFGFRYLRDRRGNWIMARKLIDEDGRLDTGDKSGPVNLDDYPFAYIAQDGKKVVDKSQIYSWPDYVLLKQSIVLEHLNKMLCFHPCLPAIEVIQIANATPMRHPDSNAPDYMKGFVNMPVPVKQDVTGPGLSQSAMPTLTAPFPAWVVEGMDSQAKSLGNLHTAYMKRLFTANSETRDMVDIEDRLTFIKNFRRYFSENKELKKGLDDAYASWEKRYRDASRDQYGAIQSMKNVQLESARHYAEIKYFHKSIVYYNDLLSLLYPDDQSGQELALFTEVPTTETANRFVENVQHLIDAQSALINVQVELAGVLNASGLKPSAQFVWQRTIDDYDFFLKPALEVAQDLMHSYGLRITREAEEKAKSLEETVEECRKAVSHYGLTVDWQNLEAGAVRPIKGEGKPRRLIADIRADLERDSAGMLSDAERERLERECDAVGSDKTITFKEWIDLKKALVEFRPTLAFRSMSLAPPWLACPVPYDAGHGFTDPTDAARALVAKIDVDSLLAWCKKPLEDANNDAVACDACALLGWYWLDVGREGLARAAFVNLARIKRARAEKREGSVEGLIDELHSYLAITAAGASMGAMPGLSAFRSDFSPLLKGKLLDWEKRWFAKGAYGPHASQQRLDLLSLASAVKTQVGRASRDWRSNRYFFPDYSFKYGAVPDILARRVLERPKADDDKPMTEEDQKAKIEKGLAEKKENVVEGAAWVLDTEAAAMAFLDKREFDGSLQKKIVFLEDEFQDK